MINYYVVYKKDSSKNFEKEFKTQGEMLDFIMLLDDGNLANYKVFEQLIQYFFYTQLCAFLIAYNVQ